MKQRKVHVGGLVDAAICRGRKLIIVRDRIGRRVEVYADMDTPTPQRWSGSDVYYTYRGGRAFYVPAAAAAE